MWQNQKIVITGVTLEKLTRGKMMNLKVRTGFLYSYDVQNKRGSLQVSEKFCFCKVKSEHKPSHVLSSLLRFLSGFCTTPPPSPPPKKKLQTLFSIGFLDSPPILIYTTVWSGTWESNMSHPRNTEHSVLLSSW